MKPVNQKRLRRRYLSLGFLVYALIVLFFAHWGKYLTMYPSSPLLIIKAVQDMLDHPFQIHPLNWPMIGNGIFLGALAPIMMDVKFTMGRDLRPRVEYGSAKWNDDLNGFVKKNADMPRIGIGSPNMILSQDLTVSMDTRKTERNNNICVFGGSGTMKSRGIILPNIGQANCSYVITDPSGELYAKTADFLRNQGYDVKALNLVNMAKSGHYNPFAYIRDEQGVLSLINALMANTTPTGKNSNDPFWDRAETALMQACCYYLIAADLEAHTHEASLSGVMQLLRLGAKQHDKNQTELDFLFSELAKVSPNHVAVASYDIYKQAPDKTASTIVICAQSRLAAFNLGVIQELTNTDDMQLGDIGDHKTALFCITPTIDRTFNFLVGLMYTQLFETLYYHAENECEENRLPIHVRFLLDEFANIGKIPDFDQKLSTMRKYEISCTIILQAISQLKTMYRDEWETIISNCDTTVYLGDNDKSTNQYISEALGKETIQVRNSSRSYGRQGSSSQSLNKSGRDLLSPDELKKMNNRDCIVMIRGYDPFFTKKFILEHHPAFGGPQGLQKWKMDISNALWKWRQAHTKGGEKHD